MPTYTCMPFCSEPMIYECKVGQRKPWIVKRRRLFIPCKRQMIQPSFHAHKVLRNTGKRNADEKGYHEDSAVASDLKSTFFAGISFSPSLSRARFLLFSTSGAAVTESDLSSWAVASPFLSFSVFSAFFSELSLDHC